MIAASLWTQIHTSGRIATATVSPLPLQIFFSFFHLALPPATSSTAATTGSTSSSLAGPPPRLVVCPLSPSPFSSSSSSLFTEWTVDVNYNSRLTVHAWTVGEQWAWIIIHVYCSCSGLYPFKKQFQKIKKKLKNPFKKIVIFSNIFLPILHNIGLYICTVKHKSSIKIPVFFWNISKKKFKAFSKKKIFCCIRPNLKIFPSVFFIKKASFSC